MAQFYIKVVRLVHGFQLGGVLNLAFMQRDLESEPGGGRVILLYQVRVAAILGRLKWVLDQWRSGRGIEEQVWLILGC